MMVFCLSSLAFAQLTYSGIAKIENHCSGSLIRFHQSKPSDKALLLSNAHCIRVLPGMVPEHLEDTRKKMDRGAVGVYLMNFDMVPSWIYPVDLHNYERGATVQVRAKRVHYVTRTLTDIVIFELNETYAELERGGVRPLMLSRKPAKPGERIAVVSGLFDLAFICTVDGIVPTLLADVTYFRNAIRYSEGCNVFKGTSGSPVISLESGEVVGINSLRNDPDDKYCANANLCEIDGASTQISSIRSGYATEVHQIYTCLDKDRRIQLDKPGCKLFGSPENPN